MISGTLEIMAAIVIVLSIVKLSVLFIEPKSWMSVVNIVYSKSITSPTIFLILAGISLWYLIFEGVTITEIFAIMLFFMLLMAAGFSIYRTATLKMAKDFFRQGEVLRKAWLYILLWIALLVWAVREVFLS